MIILRRAFLLLVLERLLHILHRLFHLLRGFFHLLRRRRFLVILQILRCFLRLIPRLFAILFPRLQFHWLLQLRIFLFHILNFLFDALQCLILLRLGFFQRFGSLTAFFLFGFLRKIFFRLCPILHAFCHRIHRFFQFQLLQLLNEFVHFLGGFLTHFTQLLHRLLELLFVGLLLQQPLNLIDQFLHFRIVQLLQSLVQGILLFLQFLGLFPQTLLLLIDLRLLFLQLFDCLKHFLLLI